MNPEPHGSMNSQPDHTQKVPRPPLETLCAIERHFQEVIRSRAADLLMQCPNLQLPTLDETTPSSKEERAWFAIPGMYGGFAYWLDLSGSPVKLITESWCRVVEGSGQRHEICAKGSKLVAEGFV
jgi:hypothetical protein